MKTQVLICVLNALAALVLLNVVSSTLSRSRSRAYTYVGDDYPIELPLEEKLLLVSMTLEETVHYELNISDPVAEREWDSLMLYPRGFGRVHLGPERRVFNIVFWHQMHCLRSMERAIQNRSHPFSTPGHVRHCLNYLRQTFLCGADHTLEDGDFTIQNFEMERIADTRMCKDWEAVESTMNRKILEFFDFRHGKHPS
ncbi:hypothetical protein P691DRAFT_805263 [Macrolepiota fuliginosa MF-IS2]|uniref:Uncharacterized protein n=1 Tax=Macrolepiota fuliginosa MF-IS2 TaxID=1400762 RepID=A0A9P6C1P0_9AGAR|nr:hypothetical protein P691DRAFT_805263 [Macrolepiota fuliginosa MF-IS2]